MNIEPDLESLLQSLNDADPAVRREAIYRLGPLKNAQAIAVLKDIVQKDNDFSCRKAALYWLQKTADQPIFNEALRHALDDPSLRTEAAWNICQSGKPNPEIVEPLIRALARGQDIDLAIIMGALGILRDPRAFEPLVVYLKSTNSHQRGSAAEALGSLGDKRAIEPLKELLNDQAIAWKEDHGPERSVAAIAQNALHRLNY